MSFVKATLFFFSVHFIIVGVLFGDEELIQKVRDQAPVAWREYLDSLKEKDLSFYSEIRSNDSELEKTPGIDVNAQYPLYFRRAKLNNGEYSITGINKDYYFSLFSSDGEKWSIIDIRKNETSSATPLNFPILGIEAKEQDVTCWYFSQLAWALKVNPRVWLPPYFDEEGFQILEAEEMREDDLRLVRVSFRYEPEEGGDKTRLRGGEVYLLPDYSWVIKKGNFEMDNPGKETTSRLVVELDYGPEPEKFPLPKSFTQSTPDQREDDYQEKWFFSWKKGDGVDPEKILLSTYGIPEPDFEDHPGRFRTILMIAGGVVILFVIFIIYRKKRRQHVFRNREK